jgi:hypothetical protein
MAPDMPRSIIYVSTELTQQTGVTMRELRFRRFVWFVASKSNIFRSDMRIAREIALAWREHGGVPPREVQRTIIRKYETDEDQRGSRLGSAARRYSSQVRVLVAPISRDGA